MRRVLVTSMVVVLVMAGVAGCSRTGSSTVTPPATMKAYHVAGACTPEAVLSEVDWLELGVESESGIRR